MQYVYSMYLHVHFASPNGILPYSCTMQVTFLHLTKLLKEYISSRMYSTCTLGNVQKRECKFLYLQPSSVWPLFQLPRDYDNITLSMSSTCSHRLYCAAAPTPSSLSSHPAGTTVEPANLVGGERSPTETPVALGSLRQVSPPRPLRGGLPRAPLGTREGWVYMGREKILYLAPVFTLNF
jgi:hypothetical protein